MKKHSQKNNKIILVYFDFPFWRIDICKIALSIGKISYQNKVISKKYFIKNKETGEFPFGQVPILIFNNVKIAQTSAMIRFCGKLTDLYSKETLNCALIDQTIDYANDLTNLIIPSIRERNEKQKKKLRKILNSEILPKWLGYLEKFHINNRVSKYFVSKQFSISDIIIWRILLWISSGKLDYISKNILEDFPEINNYFQKISENKKISKTQEYKHILSNQTTL